MEGTVFHSSSDGVIGSLFLMEVLLSHLIHQSSALSDPPDKSTGHHFTLGIVTP